MEKSHFPLSVRLVLVIVGPTLLLLCGQPAAANAERSHHVAMIYHLANIAFRCGRPLKFDPDTEQIVGDEEANRLVHQPMRAPWRV